MEKSLVKRFYVGFLIIATIFGATIIGFAIGTIITWINYYQQKAELYLPILTTAILLMVIIIFIVSSIPSFRDLSAVKQRKFEKLTGTIVRYRKIQHGGEPPTTSYRPVIKDNLTGKEVELILINRKDPIPYKHPIIKGEMIGGEHFGTYDFIYLKHTKLAVIKTNE